MRKIVLVSARRPYPIGHTRSIAERDQHQPPKRLPRPFHAATIPGTASKPSKQSHQRGTGHPQAAASASSSNQGLPAVDQALECRTAANASSFEHKDQSAFDNGIAATAKDAKAAPRITTIIPVDGTHNAQVKQSIVPPPSLKRAKARRPARDLASLGPEDLMTPDEMCRYLNIADSTGRNWRLRAYGPEHVRVSPRCLRFRKGTVDAWLAARSFRSTSETIKDA